MLPIPIPQRGGCIDSLATLFNVPGENEFVLIVCWLLAALRPIGPCPLLAIVGEQGSSKTVLTKMLRALIDPNVAPARALPREERELMIAANNGHVLAFDNLSGLPVWLSDALCRISNGGSFAVRHLYTNEDEILFHAARPAILNGIEDVVCRPDLADRAIFCMLESLSDERRRPEQELWREFELARPCMLGALLDAAAHGLRTMSNICVRAPPRMADFAVWMTACEEVLWPAGTALAAYTANRRSAIEGLIDADPVAAFIRQMMAKRSTWTGTASDLLRASIRLGKKGVSDRRVGWPRNPRALASRLRRCQTFLRPIGIEISFARRAGSRIIRMSSLKRSRYTMTAVDATNGWCRA
jgi:hypothetical protein